MHGSQEIRGEAGSQKRRAGGDEIGIAEDGSSTNPSDPLDRSIRETISAPSI